MELLKNITKRQNIDYDKIINYLLVAYALVLPISKASINVFETLIILVWLMQGNWKHKYNLYKNNLLIVSFSMLILASIISIPWASSTEYALEYIAKYRHFLIILPIYTSLNKNFVKHIFSAFLIGIFISEIMSYGIFFELWQYKNKLPTNPSPFMDHVSYSVYLSFATILLLSRLLDKEQYNIIIRLVYIIFFISATANLFINGGRTGQVTFAIIVFIGIVMNFKKKFRAFILSILFISSVFAIAHTYSFNFQDRVISTKEDINNIINNDNYEGSIAKRISLWIIGLDKAKDNLVFGTGIGNEIDNIQYYAEKNNFNPNKFEIFADHHNTLLTITLQLGIIGFVIIFTIFYSVFKLKFKSDTYKILSLTFIISFFIWSFGNHTFHTMNPMVFFALFAGLFNTLAQNKSLVGGEE